MKTNIMEPECWYDLKLGQMVGPTQNSLLMRVPGGWVYGDMQGTVFIPWNNEFQSLSPQE